jgi:hypothetical protein
VRRATNPAACHDFPCQVFKCLLTAERSPLFLFIAVKDLALKRMSGEGV